MDFIPTFEVCGIVDSKKIYCSFCADDITGLAHFILDDGRILCCVCENEGEIKGL